MPSAIHAAQIAPHALRAHREAGTNYNRHPCPSASLLELCGGIMLRHPCRQMAIGGHVPGGLSRHHASARPPRKRLPAMHSAIMAARSRAAMLAGALANNR